MILTVIMGSKQLKYGNLKRNKALCKIIATNLGIIEMNFYNHKKNTKLLIKLASNHNRLRIFHRNRRCIFDRINAQMYRNWSTCQMGVTIWSDNNLVTHIYCCMNECTSKATLFSLLLYTNTLNTVELLETWERGWTT